MDLNGMDVRRILETLTDATIELTECVKRNTLAVSELNDHLSILRAHSPKPEG
jgi:hypothetical protein